MRSMAMILLLLCVIITFGSPLFAHTIQIGSGTDTFSYLPLHTHQNYNYTQQLYTQQQINHSGEISALRFFYNSGEIHNSKDWKIYMGQSTRTHFGSAEDWEPLANLSMVYNGDVSPFLPLPNNWMHIPLDTPFHYDNNSNLIIAVYEDTAGWGSNTFWRSFTSGAFSGIYFYSDTDIPNPQNPPMASALTSTLPQIQLVFPDTSAPLAPSLLYPNSGEEVFTDARLRWQPTYGAGDPATYDLYLGSSPNPPLLASGISSTTYSPDLQGDSTYYWKVVANNAFGSSPASPVWTFDTIPDGIVQIGNASTNTYRPFCTMYGYERSAALYTQDQIGSYGMITRLAWSIATTSTFSMPYKIWMKSVSGNTLTPQTWDNLMAGATLVKEGNYTFNHEGWQNFVLDVPFIYTAGNLLIGVQSDYGDSGALGFPYLHYTANAGLVHQTWSRNGSPLTTNGTLNANLPNIIMHIAPPSGEPAFIIDPDSYDFGDVGVGSSKSMDFTITNVGGGELLVNSISISGNNDFTFSNLPALPASIAAIENTTFTLNFAPTQVGAATATITITDNTGNRSTHTLQISGNGAEYLIIGEGNANLYVPVNPNYGYTYSQCIYLQSEINTPGQRIERLAYYWNGAGSGNFSNGWTIYMGHIQRNAFLGANDWVSLNQLTQVYSGEPDIPPIAGWIELTLDTPFIYNNIDNLVIAVHESTPGTDGWNQFFYSTNTSTNRSLRYYSNNLNPSPSSVPAGVLMGGFANIKLYFDDMPAGGVFAVQPESYDFGNVRVGLDKSKSFTITNQGGGDLVINSIDILGNAAFTFSSLPSLPVTLATLQTTSFTVKFAPTLGGDASATITIEDDLGNRSEHTVEVSGNGVQDLIIGTGTTDHYLPVYPYYAYSYSQSIYLQSEIDTQDQRIERIAYYWNGLGTGNLSNDWTIYMGHTSQNAFNNTSGWIPLSQLTQVYSGILNIPATPGWIEVSLTIPFVYNNTDNLVIAVDENAVGLDGSAPFFHCTSATSPRSLRYYTDGTNPDPASPPNGTLVNGFPNLKLSFGDIPSSPELMCLPTSLDFGVYLQNQASTPQALTLLNRGVGILNLTAADISILGEDASMFNVDTGNLPAALAAGQSVSLSITFTPTSAGMKSATLRIVYNGENHDVALSGQGLSGAIITIGNATQSSSFPFFLSYEDARTQMLFTVDELMNGGALPGQTIEQVAFDLFFVYNNPTINNLMIRMKTTQVNTLTAFDTDNASFSICYLATQTLNATGWLYFQLDEPFVWNGTQNLLMDVSFNNNSWTGNSMVLSTSAPGKTWAAYSDGNNGANLTGGLAQEYRPNTRFVFSNTAGENPNCFIHPMNYSFGEVNIGGSKSKTVSIINIGGGSLGITDINISGSDTMVLSNIPNLPLYLEAAQIAQFEVIYTPEDMEGDSATVTITDDQDNRYTLGSSRDTHTLSLSGIGITDINIGEGDINARIPMDFYYKASIYETIYTQNEINHFVGLITGLKLYNSFFAHVWGRPIKIWLGSTTETDLANGWIPANQLELVFDGTMDFPAGQNTINIPFPQPYLHLDGGNLVFMIKRSLDSSYYSSSDLFKCQSGDATRARNLFNDTMDYDENNLGGSNTTGIYPQITFSVIPGRPGHINGTVLNAAGEPLPGVSVALAERQLTVQTDQQGYFSIPYQLAGNYGLTFSKHTYVTQTVNFVLDEDETEVVNITMELMPQVNVSGTILASDTGAGIAGANIRFSGYETFTGSTTATGDFTIANLFANQSYNYVISAAGYISSTGTLNLGAANHNMGNITLAEVAYAPNSVVAEQNETYTGVNLSWNAPDPNAVELTEGFEDAEFPPAGWSQIITNTGAANSMGVYPTWCSFGAINTGSGLVEPTEGAKQAGLWWVTEHQDEWLKTPFFNCPPDAYISFDTYATYGSSYGDHYYVKISTNGGNTWTVLWDASVLPEAENYYQNPIVLDLSDYAGNEVILAFHADDPPSDEGLWNLWFIDNIYIGNMVQTISFSGSDLIPGKISINSGLSANSRPNTELSRAPKLRYAESGISSSAKPHKVYTRALVGYKVWRLAEGEEDNEATWVSLTPETISNLSYVDEDWIDLPNDTYKWAVKATYTAGVLSAPAFSSSLVKEQLSGMVVGFVRRSNNQGIPGAIVTASNGTTASTNNSGAYSMVLPVGQYSFTATANGYHPLTQNEIIVAPNQNTTLNFVLIPLANEDEVVPVTVTALNGNFPNPFNPETTISYALKDAAPVRLEIYNLKGQLVRSLVNEMQPTGRYRIVFDGKDDKKLPLSSGVYLYRFSAGDYRKTQKMMLMQ